MRIIDGSSMFQMTLQEFVRSNTFKQVAQKRGFNAPPITNISTEKPAYAYVNNGRWVAQCMGCKGGAEYVWLNGPHQMFCANCGNKDINGQWRLVIVPEGDTLTVITKLLLKRPDPATQNWMPQEDVYNLLKENLEYGVM